MGRESKKSASYGEPMGGNLMVLTLTCNTYGCSDKIDLYSPKKQKTGIVTTRYAPGGRDS